MLLVLSALMVLVVRVSVFRTVLRFASVNREFFIRKLGIGGYLRFDTPLLFLCNENSDSSKSL